MGHPAKATADHILALAAGGADVETNVAAACSKCNNQRRHHAPVVLRTTLVEER